MNTTNKQYETLEEVSIRIFPPDLSNIDEEPFEVDFNKPDRDIFIQGANWQKEQDKVIIDKLIDTLGNTLSILERERNYIGVSLYKSYAPYYDKAKELLQSLK